VHSDTPRRPHGIHNLVHRLWNTARPPRLVTLASTGTVLATAGPGGDRDAYGDEESGVAESYNGYCVKCKEKRDFDGEVKVSESGRRMAQGTCPVCGTKMNRILGKA
jgi:hypothetical protein